MRCMLLGGVFNEGDVTKSMKQIPINDWIEALEPWQRKIVAEQRRLAAAKIRERNAREAKK